MELTEAEYKTSLATLADYLKIRSVPHSPAGVKAAVDFLQKLITGLGGTVQVLDNKGHVPVLYAHFCADEPAARTLLFYDHYDVLDAGDLDEWASDPFLPEVRDGILYARGTSDNKGSLIQRLTAVAKLRRAHALHCNVTFFIEGEEETGSHHIESTLAAHPALFACDACIWEFGSRDARGNVELFAGVKGLLYVELTCVTADVDIHAMFGGAIEGANDRMIKALATLKNPAGRVRIPHFYDSIAAEMRPRLLMSVDKLPLTRADLQAAYGLRQPLHVGSDAQLRKRLTFAPTLTVSGLAGGYTGPGQKSIVPRLATAKLDIRLARQQDPVEVERQLRQYLAAGGFSDIGITVLEAQPGSGLDDLDDPFLALVAKTAATAYHSNVITYPVSFGTGPFYLFKRYLHVPIVSTGVGWLKENAHGPNESIRLVDYRLGIGHMLAVLASF